MEYIPYRRRALSRMRDEPMHRYFAEHGYASLRVDPRGSGDSSGLLEDEYTRQEWDDGVEAIAWIAAQPWCNGSVCEDYGAIEAAVYAVGGWADGYSNAVFRMMEGLASPRRTTVGTWGHLYPREGVPGPAVGFLEDAVSWWKRCLGRVFESIRIGLTPRPQWQCIAPPSGPVALCP